MKRLCAVVVALSALLAGCQTRKNYVEEGGGLKGVRVFEFAGESWEISHRLEAKDLLGGVGTYGAWMRRPSRPLADNPVDMTAAVQAAIGFLTPIMNCPPHLSPQPASYGLVPGMQPPTAAVYLSCYRR